MKLLAAALTLLLMAFRWSILAAILFTEPKTSDTIAELLFGPARLTNDFPRFFLPAIGLGEFHLLRFLGGELFWIAVVAVPAYALVVLLRRR